MINIYQVLAKEDFKGGSQMVGHAIDPPGVITALGDIDIAQGPLQLLLIMVRFLGITFYHFPGL